jgi:hypothetical protein
MTPHARIFGSTMKASEGACNPDDPLTGDDSVVFITNRREDLAILCMTKAYQRAQMVVT